MATYTIATNMAYKANRTKLSKHNKFTTKKSQEKKFKELRKKQKKKYRTIAARDSVRASVIAEKLEAQIQFLKDEKAYQHFKSLVMHNDFCFNCGHYDRYLTCLC